PLVTTSLPRSRGRQPAKAPSPLGEGRVGPENCPNDLRYISGARGRKLDNRRSFELVLLLNASLQPLNVISKRRLVVLLTKQRVTFMDEVARQAVEQAMARRCFGQDVVIVRLLSNIQIPRRLLRANRRNLLLRDDGTCQYCGKGMPSAQLSVDHVVPTSRGGAANSWENHVIACRR